MKNLKKVLLIEPSRMIARGLEATLCDLGEFRVEGILTDLSRASEMRLRAVGADVIVVDPVVFDFASRSTIKARIAELTDAPVLALQTSPLDDEAIKQFDGVIGIYDDPVAVVRKLRDSIGNRQEQSDNEGQELSAREKEILICVAKGMLNKEIADECNLSIHTVITHRKNITRKTGIKTVAGLTVYALLNNLIDPGSVEM